MVTWDTLSRCTAADALSSEWLTQPFEELQAHPTDLLRKRYNRSMDP